MTKNSRKWFYGKWFLVFLFCVLLTIGFSMIMLANVCQTKASHVSSVKDMTGVYNNGRVVILCRESDILVGYPDNSTGKVAGLYKCDIMKRVCLV
jgi:hypothetical protein